MVAKYSVYITIKTESGTRSPTNTIHWSCKVLPSTHLDGGELYHSGADEREAAVIGIATAKEHADKIGDQLVLDDVEVTVSRERHILKRGKLADVQRSSGPSSYGRSAFQEVMARPPSQPEEV